MVAERVAKHPTRLADGSSKTPRRASAKSCGAVSSQRRPATSVSVRGKDAVVVISVEELERLAPADPHRAPFIAFMEGLHLDGLDITREPDLGRDVDLVKGCGCSTTNVVAALISSNGAPSVKAWVAAQPEHWMYLSILTLGEYATRASIISPTIILNDRVMIAARDALEGRFASRDPVGGRRHRASLGRDLGIHETSDGSSAFGDRHSPGGDGVGKRAVPGDPEHQGRET